MNLNRKIKNITTKLTFIDALTDSVVKKRDFDKQTKNTLQSTRKANLPETRYAGVIII